MRFHIKELFYTIQGEGYQTGRPAVFCRFSGCNLWSGREQDRSTAQCQFCDTDFVGSDAGVFKTEEELIEAIYQTFPTPPIHNKKGIYSPYLIFTGGEPSLQLTQRLIDLLHLTNIKIGIETNGTRPLPHHIDWITVSPKGGNALNVVSGNELKLVWPQKECSPETFRHLEFEYFVLQPKDDAYLKENTQQCINYCMQHPQWRLGLQTHKWLGLH